MTHQYMCWVGLVTMSLNYNSGGGARCLQAGEKTGALQLEPQLGWCGGAPVLSMKGTALEVRGALASRAGGGGRLPTEPQKAGLPRSFPLETGQAPNKAR